MKTFADSPASRAAGVMMVRSPTRIVRPSRTAARTSSSQTNGTGVAGGGEEEDGAEAVGEGVAATEAPLPGLAMPREARN